MHPVEIFFIVICVLWLLSSLLHNNKKEAFKENLSLVFFLIFAAILLIGVGWFYSLGDR
jgi:uncharacterized membrane protein